MGVLPLLLHLLMELEGVWLHLALLLFMELINFEFKNFELTVNLFLDLIQYKLCFPFLLVKQIQFDYNLAFLLKFFFSQCLNLIEVRLLGFQEVLGLFEVQCLVP